MRFVAAHMPVGMEPDNRFSFKNNSLPVAVAGHRPQGTGHTQAWCKISAACLAWSRTRQRHSHIPKVSQSIQRWDASRQLVAVSEKLLQHDQARHAVWQ